MRPGVHRGDEGCYARSGMFAGPIAASALSLIVAVSPSPKAPGVGEGRSPDVRLGLGLGLGLPGGLMFGTGLGVVLRHRAVYPRVMPAPGNATYVAAVNATNAGALMIGAGLGLGATALTASLGARDRALWGEFAGGGALAIAGAAWYVTEWQSVQKMLYDGGKLGAAIDGAAMRREAASSSFLGAGIGLALGAGVALLTRHLVGRRRARSGRVAVESGCFGAGVLAHF